MSKAYDCLLCGACCASPFDGEGYIQVEPEDRDRLRSLALPVIEMEASGERLLLLSTRLDGQGKRVCRALEGKVGRRVACSVYEDRPHLCREFEAGTPECLAARRAIGLSG